MIQLLKVIIPKQVNVHCTENLARGISNLIFLDSKKTSHPKAAVKRLDHHVTQNKIKLVFLKLDFV